MPSAADRRIAWLLLVAAVLFLPALGLRDFWAPDEPRYAEVVREMRMEGDWLVLRDNGRLYTDKPPLFFWMAALAATLSGGVSEFTARLPSALAGIAGVLLTFVLGRELFSPRAGFLGGAVLATTYGFFSESNWVHLDTTLTLWVSLSLFCLWKAAREDPPPIGWRLGFYLCLGLGVLTKGPVALVLPLAAGAVFFLWVGESRRWLRWGLWWGLPLAAGMGVAWALAAQYSSGGEYRLSEVLSTHVLERASRGLHHHRGPAYYLLHLPVNLLPWAIFLPVVLFDAIRRVWRSPDRGMRFCLSWAGAMFVLFTVSVEKRGIYMLPLLPALAVVCGWFFDRRMTSPADRRQPAVDVPVAAWGMVLIALCWVPWWYGASRPGMDGVGMALSGLLLLLGAVHLRAGWRGGARRGFGTVWAGGALLLLFFSLVMAPALDRYKSARPFCERVRERVGSRPLCFFGLYRSAYVYYTGRFVEEIHDPARFADFLSRPDPAFCLVPESAYREVVPTLGEVPHVVDREAVGHRMMYLIANPAGRADPPMDPGAASGVRAAPGTPRPAGSRSEIRRGAGGG